MKFLILASIAAITYYGYISTGPKQLGYIGIQYCPGNHKIIKVWQHSPAETAGLKPGDRVSHINAADIDGPIGTKINMTIKRGTDILMLILERVPRETIDWKHEVKSDTP